MFPVAGRQGTRSIRERKGVKMQASTKAPVYLPQN